MEPTPAFLNQFLSALPAAGLLMLGVSLIALGARRDRLILPGLIAVILLVAGAGAALEYQTELRAMIAPPEPPKPTPTVAMIEPPAPEPQPEPGAEPEPQPEPEPEPAATRATTPRSNRLIPAAPIPEPVERPGEDGRRRVIVPGRPQPTTTAREPEPAPAPAPVARTPAPAPAPAQPEPTPQPRPQPQPAPRPAPAPSPAPQPSGSGGATLKLNIAGPIVETSKIPVADPHILVIVKTAAGSVKVQKKPPSRVTEQRQDDKPDGQLLAVTYFWENISFSFSGLDPGYCVVMIDSSLESSGSHQGKMMGAGQDDNDYNGAVELKPGATTTMRFGAKNWASGKLPSPAIQ